MFSLICKQYYFFVYLLFFFLMRQHFSVALETVLDLILLIRLILNSQACLCLLCAFSLFGRKVSSLGQKEQAPPQGLTQFITVTHFNLRNFPWSFRDLDSNKTRSLVSTQNNFRTEKKNWYVLKTYTQRKNKHTNSVSVDFSRVY